MRKIYRMCPCGHKIRSGTSGNICEVCHTEFVEPIEHWIRSLVEYQVKVRYQGDLRKWEDIPVEPFRWLFSRGESARAQAECLKSLDPAIREIRYNAKGSLQGYYV